MTADDHSGEGRVTAPMQRYSNSEVLVGALVCAVGLLISYVVPALA